MADTQRVAEIAGERAAPGDTTERARALYAELRKLWALPAVSGRLIDEAELDLIAASLTAAEDGARRATLAKFIEAVCEEARHWPADNNPQSAFVNIIERARALTTEATPGEG